jgi:hypothetical protein
VEADILVVGLAVLGFALVASRLEGSPLTMPMVFTALGVLLAPGVLGVLHIDVGNEGVSVLAEATLAIVLFTDASRMDLRNSPAITRSRSGCSCSGSPSPSWSVRRWAWFCFPSCPSPRSPCWRRRWGRPTRRSARRS